MRAILQPSSLALRRHARLAATLPERVRAKIAARKVRFPPKLPEGDRTHPFGVDLSRVDVEKTGPKKDFDPEKIFRDSVYSPSLYPRPFISAANERDKRIRKTVAKYELRRMALKAIIYNQHLDLDIRFHASQFLGALPRDGSKTRVRNRCQYNGQARAVYKKWGLNRFMVAKFTREGLLPGVKHWGN